MNITIRYRSVDGCNYLRRFKTLEGARKYAHKMIGEHPDMGNSYAVSFDGIGTIHVAGVSLSELFPDAPKPELTEADFE